MPSDCALSLVDGGLHPGFLAILAQRMFGCLGRLVRSRRHMPPWIWVIGIGGRCAGTRLWRGGPAACSRRPIICRLFSAQVRIGKGTFFVCRLPPFFVRLPPFFVRVSFLVFAIGKSSSGCHPGWVRPGKLWQCVPPGPTRELVPDRPIPPSSSEGRGWRCRRPCWIRWP